MVWDDVRAVLPGPTAVARYPRGGEVPVAEYAAHVADQIGGASVAMVAPTPSAVWWPSS